ncbi:MAG: class I SAM-dependent methyltransferase [Propionibacteriales bacterium]|nr:class I SAM-dependent methyltransferase [Propionibacteriales bacterium]
MTEVAMRHSTQQDRPEIAFRRSEHDGSETLFIDGEQAMQAWEAALMRRSAAMLCACGQDFVEAGLGFGFSALEIARADSTRTHRVIEPYREVINAFHAAHPVPPDNLEIVHADFFNYLAKLEPDAIDGIFFDPALPPSMWDDEPFWMEMIPHFARVVRPGGGVMPFFTSSPKLRARFARAFDRIVIERHAFTAYDHTNYTDVIEGDAYVQLYTKGVKPLSADAA